MIQPLDLTQMRLTLIHHVIFIPGWWDDGCIWWRKGTSNALIYNLFCFFPTKLKANFKFMHEGYRIIFFFSSLPPYTTNLTRCHCSRWYPTKHRLFLLDMDPTKFQQTVLYMYIASHCHVLSYFLLAYTHIQNARRNFVLFIISCIISVNQETKLNWSSKSPLHTWCKQ